MVDIIISVVILASVIAASTAYIKHKKTGKGCCGCTSSCSKACKK